MRGTTNPHPDALISRPEGATPFLPRGRVERKEQLGRTQSSKATLPLQAAGPRDGGLVPSPPLPSRSLMGLWEGSSWGSLRGNDSTQRPLQGQLASYGEHTAPAPAPTPRSVGLETGKGPPSEDIPWFPKAAQEPHRFQDLRSSL